MKRQIMETIGNSAPPVTLPVAYVSFFDHFSDPLKLAGFGVMLLQGIYICVKIFIAYRREKRREEVNENY